MMMERASKMVHVPYRAAGPRWAICLRATIDLMFEVLPTHDSTHQDEGRLRALAVTTGSGSGMLRRFRLSRRPARGLRVPRLDRPAAPRPLPQALIARLMRCAKPWGAAISNQAVSMGSTSRGATPEDFAAFMARGFGELRPDRQSGRIQPQ